MILDYLALLSKNADVNSELTTTDIFNTLVDLEQRGIIQFDYEILTIVNSNKTVISSSMHELKHFILEIIQKNLGIDKIQEEVSDELTYRLNIYLNEQKVLSEYVESSSSGSSSSSGNSLLNFEYINCV